LERLKRALAQQTAFVELFECCPDLEAFIASLDASGFSRLLGIFVSSPDEHLCSEKVLERHGHHGYCTLRVEITGDQREDGRCKSRAWTSAVKRPEESDEHFRIVIGITKQPLTGNATSDKAARWGEIAAVVHELGHADDLTNGITFQADLATNIEEAEYYAHQYACRFFRDRKLVMGIVAYLSSAVCALSRDPEGSASRAATRFLHSEDYRLSLQMVPKLMQRQYRLIEVS
jgi:hypothetical protein